MMPLHSRRGWSARYLHVRFTGSKFGMKETCISEFEYIKGWKNIKRL